MDKNSIIGSNNLSRLHIRCHGRVSFREFPLSFFIQKRAGTRVGKQEITGGNLYNFCFTRCNIVAVYEKVSKSFSLACAGRVSSENMVAADRMTLNSFLHIFFFFMIYFLSYCNKKWIGLQDICQNVYILNKMFMLHWIHSFPCADKSPWGARFIFEG